MKTTASFALFIALTAQTSSLLADCEYEGKKYKTLETLSVMDPAYTEEIAKMGYSPDGYALVLKCMPVVDVKRVAAGDFSIVDIPAKEDQWTISDIIYSHSEISVHYGQSHSITVKN